MALDRELVADENEQGADQAQAVEVVAGLSIFGARIFP